MTLDDAIEFIVAKTELLAEHTPDPQQREFLQKWLKNYDQMWSHPRLSMQQLRSLDGEMLEGFLEHSTSPGAETEVRRKLFARFKTSRLRKSDASAAKRALKCGRIADLEEWYQVKEFVSCVDNIDVIGEENYGILDSLLENYDGPSEEIPEPEPLATEAGTSKPSRRRPPPPFDFTLVDDEKLCPPETPLDTRVAFVRARIALVVQRITDREQRESLRSSLLMTLDGQLGQAQTQLARAAAAEWSEHEADCFAGYQVNGAAHREFEADLEKEFGFRRLGPSAQERLRRMLRTNDALGRENRLVIERFIYAYPHQTLFTREEIKRAEVLLKQPSPSQPPPKPTMTPRPKMPPDLSQLCVGAVFNIQHCDKPCRVLAFDELEVCYDVDWGADLGWGLGTKRSRAIYYRHITPLFLDGAEKLRIDPLPPEYLALHRPDLPLRFARSAHVEWREHPCATRDELIAWLEQDPSRLDLTHVDARELVLIPRSPNGAWQRGVLVTAENGKAFSTSELLCHAQQLQRPFKKDGMSGIGIYRSGLETNGVPSYVLSCYLEPGSLLEWHAKAPVAQ